MFLVIPEIIKMNRQIEPRLCFFIARYSSDYIRELVYWQINSQMAERIASYLYDVIRNTWTNGCKYKCSFFPISKLEEDIKNGSIDTILGLRCKPGFSKIEIVTEFSLENFPNMDAKYFNDDETNFTREFCCELALFVCLSEVNDSIVLTLLEMCKSLNEL